MEVRPIERVRLTGAFEWFDSVPDYVVVRGPNPDQVLVDLPEGLAIDQELHTVLVGYTYFFE